MLSDGYEDFCSDLVEDAAGHDAQTRADLCACDELLNS